MFNLSGFNSAGPCGCCSSSLSCSPCDIPQQDLYVDYLNSFLGNGTVTLTYTAPGSWSTGSTCPGGLVYTLSCPGGAVVFSVTYYISGSCPTGSAQSCASNKANPLRLTLTSTTCSPLSLVYSVTGASCPTLWNSFYSQFTVRE